MGGRNHHRAGKTRAAKQLLEMALDQIGDEKKQPSKLGAEFSRRKIQLPHIGDFGRVRPDRGRTFFVAPAWQARKPFLAQDQRDTGRAQRVTLAAQRRADVVNGEVLFAQADHLGARRIARRLIGGNARALLRRQEELALGIAAEGVAEHAETAGRVAETPGHVRRALLLDEIGAQRLVLPMGRIRGLQEDPGESRYLFPWSDRHTTTISSRSAPVKPLDMVGFEPASCSDSLHREFSPGTVPSRPEGFDTDWVALCT